MSAETSMMISEADGIRVDREGPILTVILTNPENLNAQTPATWRRLAAIISGSFPAGSLAHTASARPVNTGRETWKGSGLEP